MEKEKEIIEVVPPSIINHESILIGWKEGKIFYCRTFDDQNDRENMFKAFDFVKKKCDKYALTSTMEDVIIYPESNP